MGIIQSHEGRSPLNDFEKTINCEKSWFRQLLCYFACNTTVAPCKPFEDAVKVIAPGFCLV